MRKNFGKIYFIKVHQTSQKIYNHHITKNLYLFSLFAKKAKFCANVSRNVFYVLEKRLFSFPPCFRQNSLIQHKIEKQVQEM